LVVVSGNRPTFILGHAYPHGIWFFFPVLLVLKSSPGFLGLLLAALALALIAKRLGCLPVVPGPSATLWRVLWVSLSTFAAICILSHFNVSVRHFTIPLVLMIQLLAPVPRLLARMREASPKLAWVSGALVVLLAVSCVASAMRAYPNYFAYMDPIASGHPAYWYVTDSNLDWNQALPEVNQFARQHSLNDLPMDIYGMFDSNPWVPNSRLWDCQAPSDADAGKWVVVSANMILDGHNCIWLTQYPQEAIAGGSMYAVHLPATIPPAGSPGGPPPVAERRIFLGMPFDMREFFQRLARRPEDIPKALAEIQDTFQKQMQERKKK
jgi:hypothetical protein